MAGTTTAVVAEEENPKRTTRAKKTETTTLVEATPMSGSRITPLNDDFETLIKNISKARETFEKLQKEITETKTNWEIEQKTHQMQVTDRDSREEILRKRDQELYEYDEKLRRKKDEDEFSQRKIQWERELTDNKEIIAKERKELVLLREQVAGFEKEKEQAVNEAAKLLQKELESGFETEKRLSGQETKSERAIFELKINNLTQEATRQKEEIAELKHSLEKAAAQLKDMAVTVIESGKQPLKTSFTSDAE